MRVATIGEDGVIRDADGIAHFGKSRRPAPRPVMLRNAPRTVPGLGQAAVITPSLVMAAPDIPGPAFESVRATALPASRFEYSRKLGDQDTQIYPGRLVISDAPEYQVAYTDSAGKTVTTGTVFRVSARVSPEDSKEYLFSLQGKQAGSHFLVPLQELLSDKYRVVKPADVSLVELNIPDMPPLYLDGKLTPERTTGVWALNEVEDGILALDTLPRAYTPVHFSEQIDTIRTRIVVGLMLLRDGIETAGMAYDLSTIGYKSLCIITRVAHDAFTRALDLLPLLDVKGAQSIRGTTDPAKISAFWAQVDELERRSPYWAALLARSMLYQAYTTVFNSFLARVSCDTIGRIIGGMNDAVENQPEEIEKILVKLSETKDGPPIAPERAKAMLAQAKPLYKNLLGIIDANKARLDPEDKALFGDDWTPGDAPLVLMTYTQMLSDNAETILKLKKELGGTPKEFAVCLDLVPGLSQVLPAVMPAPPGDAPRLKLIEDAVNSLREKTTPKDTTDLSSMIKSGELVVQAALSMSTLLKGKAFAGKPDIKIAETFEQGAARIAAYIKARSSAGTTKEALAKLEENNLGTSFGQRTLVKEALNTTARRYEGLANEAQWTDAYPTAKDYLPVLEAARKRLVMLWEEGIQGPTGNLTSEGKPEFARVALGLAFTRKTEAEGKKPGSMSTTTVRVFSIEQAIDLYEYFLKAPISIDMCAEFTRAYLKDFDIKEAEAVTLADNILKQKQAKAKTIEEGADSVRRYGGFKQAVTGSITAADLVQLKKDIDEAAGIVAVEKLLPADQKGPATSADVANLIGEIQVSLQRVAGRTKGGDNKQVKGTGSPWTEDLYLFTELNTYKVIRDTYTDVNDAYEGALTAVRALEQKIKDSLMALEVAAPTDLIKVTGDTLSTKGINREKVNLVIAELKEARRVAEEAMLKLRPHLRGASGTRSLVKAGEVLLLCGRNVGTWVGKFHEGALKRNSTAFVYCLFLLPQLAASAASLIMLPFAALGWVDMQLVKNVLVAPSVAYGWVLGLLGYHPAGYDPGPSSPGGSRTRPVVKPRPDEMSPIAKLALLGVGVSLIFSGGKVFGAVDKFFASIAKIIDSMAKIFQPRKKKKVGRPSGEGGGGRGRGRPPKIDKAKDEVARAEAAVEEAEGSGSESRAKSARERLEKAEGKLKKAEEAEFFKGLIGNFWRLNDA